MKTNAVLTEDLSTMPFPDYSIFERDRTLTWLRPNAIESRKLLSVPVMTGRGCPYRCSYCSNVSMLDLYGDNHKYLRKYDLDSLLCELTRLKERYRVDFFQIVDETFLWDKEYALDFLRAYKNNLGLPFSMFSRVEQMDETFCRLAAEAGCHSVWYGVESGSEEYRRRYLGRTMTNDRLLQAAETARRNGIKIMAFAMVGMPFETREQIEETLELISQIRPERAIFGQFIPLPGTPLYQLSKDAGLLLKPSPNHQMCALGNLSLKEHPGSLSAEQMRQVAEEIKKYVDANTFLDE